VNIVPVDKIWHELLSNQFPVDPLVNSHLLKLTLARRLLKVLSGHGITHQLASTKTLVQIDIYDRKGQWVTVFFKNYTRDAHTMWSSLNEVKKS